MYNFGYIKSELDGTEKVYEGHKTADIPDSYSCMENLPKPLNQGEYSICVPCSISAFLNWRESLKTGTPTDINVDLFGIYNSKTNAGEGMTFKDAFRYLKHEGVKTSNGIKNIGYYAMVKNWKSLQKAIYENGPCVGALPVYGDNYGYDSEFWQKNKGQFQGGHAISIMGYTPEGFIIRNSWGESYGKHGYTFLNNNDFKNFFEI